MLGWTSYGRQDFRKVDSKYLQQQLMDILSTKSKIDNEGQIGVLYLN